MTGKESHAINSLSHQKGKLRLRVRKALWTVTGIQGRWMPRM